MRRRRRGAHNYKFTEKTHSIRGIIAIVLAAVSLLACGWMLWYSYSSRGNAGIYVGSAGIFGFFVAVVSVIMADFKYQRTGDLPHYSVCFFGSFPGSCRGVDFTLYRRNLMGRLERQINFLLELIS